MSFSLDARIPLGFQGFDPAVGQRNALLRLQQQAAEAELDERNSLNAALQRAGAGLSADDPAKRAAAAAEIGQVGRRGMEIAAPILSEARGERALADFRTRLGGGGAPSAAPAAMPAASGSGGFSENGLAINTRSESSGDPNARPRFPDGTLRSSSAGPNQFIDGTWLAFAGANPQLFQGMSRQQILDARRDPALSAQATQWYARRNAAALHGAGVPVNDATLGLAHQFDGPVAARIATAPPNTPIDQIVGPAAMRANPDLAGQTAGQVMQRFSQRYGGAAGGVAPTRPGPSDAEMRILEEGLASPHEAVRRAAQSRLQVLQMQRRDPTDSYRDDTREIGGRRVQGQVNVRTGRFEAFPGQTREGGDALSPAQAAADVRQLAPLILQGRATPEQEIAYATAVGVWQSTGQRAQVPADPNDPSRGMVEVVVPRPLPEGFPAPRPLQDIVGARIPDAPAAPTVPAASPAAAPQPAAPQQGVTLPGTTMTAEPPRNPNAPRVIGGGAPSAAALNDARKLETDARNVALSAERFRAALETFRGATGAAAFNPRSPEGARLQQAFENFKMSLRGEAFANTGVLQPGENVMLDSILRNPRSLSGLLASVDASIAQFDELLGYVEDRVNTVREQSRLPRVRIRPDARGDTGGGPRPPLDTFFRAHGR